MIYQRGEELLMNADCSSEMPGTHSPALGSHSLLSGCLNLSPMHPVIAPDGGKEIACSAGDPGSIPGSGRCPGEGNGNPLQYSCLENPTDRGAWRATVHGVTKSWPRLKRLNSHHFLHQLGALCPQHCPELR